MDDSHVRPSVYGSRSGPGTDATGRPGPSGDEALREGDLAARDLAEALKLAGITLPSLRGDFPGFENRPLVHLGGASAALARELAAWVRGRA
ncbi:hypothetical protein [Streptomyces sp. NPDC007088]|uniref:hypothetical protein n=1 Tax=Streptomyces sp. NPDC007088 TaxID=3364773 RepID=UPI0036B18838